MGRLAEQAGVSARTLARRFAEQLGHSPAKWLLAQRLAAARALLEQTQLPVEAIAIRVGLSSALNCDAASGPCWARHPARTDEPSAAERPGPAALAGCTPKGPRPVASDAIGVGRTSGTASPGAQRGCAGWVLHTAITQSDSPGELVADLNRTQLP